MIRRCPLGGILLLTVLVTVSHNAAGAETAAIGDKVPNSNSLRDLRGNRRSLHDFKGHSAIVIAFLGADCPISNLYLPGLIELEKKYRSKQVQFLAVYANEPEDLDQVAAHASDRDVPFPVLKDFGQKLADRLGVTRVPSVVGPRRRLRAALPRPDRRPLRRRRPPRRRRRATISWRPSTKCWPARR